MPRGMPVDNCGIPCAILVYFLRLARFHYTRIIGCRTNVFLSPLRSLKRILFLIVGLRMFVSSSRSLVGSITYSTREWWVGSDDYVYCSCTHVFVNIISSCFEIDLLNKCEHKNQQCNNPDYLIFITHQTLYISPPNLQHMTSYKIEREVDDEISCA